MEPQLTDYYNEEPYGVKVIEKLNKEFLDLHEKYDELETKIKQYIPPTIIVKNIEDHKYHTNLLWIEFPKRCKGFLKGNNGLSSNISPVIYQDYIPNVYEIFRCNTCGKESCKEEIINELNTLTNNKNKQWCQDRINMAFKLCLSKYENISSLDEEEITDDLIHHIMNDENNDYLPSLYIDIISKFYITDRELYGLYDLVCFYCEKCGNMDNNDPNVNRLLCIDCDE